MSQLPYHGRTEGGPKPAARLHLSAQHSHLLAHAALTDHACSLPYDTEVGGEC